MHQVLFGSALLISFLGGVMALLAPCCVSVMLPAFFATGFGRRSGIAAAQLRAAGIGQVASITSDPASAITQKAHDMGLTIPVLSDPGLAVSQQYRANSYGMMGASRDGHTFILVGPDGVIRWRADYGGPPKYTMFLPTTALLAGIKAGEHPS